MSVFQKNTNHTDALLNIAMKRGAVDRIAAYQYCIAKGWLCAYGQITDKGFRVVTANIYTDATAA